MRSPYSVLGINKSAKDDDIKTAYRKLAKIWHPDQNPSDPKAAEVFSEINNAYQLLTDGPRRKLFDGGKIDANGRRKKKHTFVNQGFNPFAKSKTAASDDEKTEKKQKANVNTNTTSAASKQTSATKPSTEQRRNETENPFANASFGDMIGQIFGTEEERVAFEAKARKIAAEREKNYQHEAISALDSAFTKFEQHREKSTTQAPDRNFILDVELADIFTGVTLPVQPERKNGVKVHIPAGTPDGGEVRLAGMGDCRKGEIPGDIIVKVRYRPNEKFWIRNGELHTHLAVDLADAVLGGEVVAQTPEGPATFQLPEWTSSNHVIRIPNRGLPNLNGERGDLCANVCILLPERQNEDLKTILKSTRKSWFV
jgi:DnaJ-class molecular chaperone